MIKLYFVDQTTHNEDSVAFVVCGLLPKLDPSKDLIIVPSTRFLDDCYLMANMDNVSSKRNHFRYFLDSGNIVESNNIDLEKISAQKLRNIVLINFDEIEHHIIRCLVNKSKKTEIVGFSSSNFSYSEDIEIELSNCKQNGFTDDQTLVWMTLKHGHPTELIQVYMSGGRYRKDIKFQKIETLSNILNHIKT